MTDFIHEAPPPENPKPAAPEKPTSEKERQKRVYAYIAVLFTVAFILILWSFLANHRSNQQVIDQLKGSTSMMQSTLEQNAKLEDEVKALETEIEEQMQAFAKAEDAYRASADRQEAIITALDWLGELERYYNAGKLNTARETAQAMRDNGLVPFLPDYPLHTSADGDYEAPAERYQTIADKLFPNGMD